MAGYFYENDLVLGLQMRLVKKEYPHLHPLEVVPEHLDILSRVDATYLGDFVLFPDKFDRRS